MVDHKNKIIYEKEFKVSFFTKYPEKPYEDFLEMLKSYVEKGYRVKTSNGTKFSAETEKMLKDKVNHFTGEKKASSLCDRFREIYKNCGEDYEKFVLEVEKLRKIGELPRRESL